MNKIKRELIELLENKGYEVIVNDYRLLIRHENKDIIFTNKDIEKLSVIF